MPMTNPELTDIARPQAVVAGGIADEALMTGRAGGSEFAVGTAMNGANPYDLLSASLAACTAMTIRFQARRKNYPLSHVEVAASYHHGGHGEPGVFERTIT